MKNKAKIFILSLVIILTAAAVCVSSCISFATEQIPDANGETTTASDDSTTQQSESPQTDPPTEAPFTDPPTNPPTDPPTTQPPETEPTTEKITAAKPTPRLIVSKYSYGTGEIEAGTDFTLSIELKNTSAYYDLDNVMITLTCGGAFKLNNSSNSIYINIIPKNQVITENVQISTLANDPNADTSIMINMQYEYVDDSHMRSTGNQASETIIIPVVYKDRVVVGDPSFEDQDIYYTTDVNITLPVTNMGKTTVSNLQATIDTDMEVDTVTQYKGNLEPGGKATFEFMITTGFEESEMKFTITYEDAAGKTVTVEKILSIEPLSNPDDGFNAPDFPIDTPPEEESNNKTVLTIAIAVFVLAVVAAVVIFVIARRKKNKAGLDAELKAIAEDELNEEDMQDDLGITDADDVGMYDENTEETSSSDDDPDDINLDDLNLDDIDLGLGDDL